MASELVGRVFHLQSVGLIAHHRVIYVAAELDLIMLYPLTLRPCGDGQKASFVVTARKPVTMALGAFRALDEHQRAEVEVTLPPFVDRAYDELSKAQMLQYDRISARMAHLADPQFLLEQIFREPYSATLARRARELGVDRTTLARDASRYFLCDLDVRKACMLAVLGKSKPRTARKVTQKLGRKNKLVSTGHMPEAVGINVDAFIIEALTVFLPSQKDSIKLNFGQMYERFKRSHSQRAGGTLADGTVIYRRDPRLSITKGQFDYHVKKLRSVKAREIHLIGRAKFNKDRRLLLGTARDGIQHPGQCYIIDSTVLDVYLVSAFDRRNLVGRPAVYVVIDAFSSLILSVHVSLESASVAQAKIAVYRAMTSKDQLVDALGTQSLLSALPQGCQPSSIFADRGELLSNGGRTLAEDLGVRMSFAAPYRADWKSLVERYFGIQNDAVVHFLPGAVRARAKERGDRDVRHDAVLTVNGVLRLLLSLAAEWNLTKDMSKHLSAGMLRTNTEATPLGFWRYGLEHLHGAPHYLDRQDAIRTCLTPTLANASRTGLRVLEGLRYTAPWMSDDDAFYAQTQEGRANMYLDPDRPFGAFMVEPSTGQLRPVALVDNRQYDEQDMSIYDIRDAEALIGLDRAVAEKAYETPILTLQKQREKIVNDEAAATRQQKQGDTRSKTRRVAELKDNCRHEKSLNLGLGLASVEDPASASVSSPADGDASDWDTSIGKQFGVPL